MLLQNSEYLLQKIYVFFQSLQLKHLDSDRSQACDGSLAPKLLRRGRMIPAWWTRTSESLSRSLASLGTRLHAPSPREMGAGFSDFTEQSHDVTLPQSLPSN
jgi:hypothetical protein